nr:phosphate butyryltransferase [candidate division Zixibacteria bacterium]
MDGKPITSSDQIIESAIRLARIAGKKVVAVAGASDVDVLGALASAHADGILEAALFGEKNKIEKAADEGGIDISGLEIMPEADAAGAVYGAVKMAAEGRADIIMKGFVSTSALLKTVLSRDFSLRTKNLVSHTAVLDIPGYHKLLSMTDGGMVVRPNFDQKIQIIENAVLVARALGLMPVRVAISGAFDQVREDMPLTIENSEIKARIEMGNMEDVVIQGPMTFDAATSAEVCRIKGITGPVAGQADIFVVNSIEECNIIAKALINFVEAVFAGVIVGARVPISLVSRTDTIKNKKASVSIACLVAEYYKQSGVMGGDQ